MGSLTRSEDFRDKDAKRLQNLTTENYKLATKTRSRAGAEDPDRMNDALKTTVSRYCCSWFYTVWRSERRVGFYQSFSTDVL